MDRKEEFKALFVGKSTGFLGTFKLQNGDLFIKERSLNPFKNDDFTATHKFVNQKLENPHVVKLIDRDKGRTDEEVRVYFIDFDTFEKDYTNVNVEIQRELESLKTHNDYLFNTLQSLQSLIHRSGVKELLQDNFKKEYDFYTQSIRPPFIPNKDGDKKK